MSTGKLPKRFGAVPVALFKQLERQGASNMYPSHILAGFICPALTSGVLTEEEVYHHERVRLPFSQQGELWTDRTLGDR